VSEADINLKILTRSIPSVHNGSPFSYFDGATMQSYMYPSKGSEVVFCRGNFRAEVCDQNHGFDPERLNIPLSEALEVKPSTLGENAGRGVFAKRDIPQNSYAGLDKLIKTVYMSPATYDLTNEMERHWTADSWWGEVLEVYSHGYGHSFSKHVSFRF
jgi:hypothetical protein